MISKYQNYLDKMLFDSIKVLTNNKEREELSDLYSESLMIVATNLDRIKELIDIAEQSEENGKILKEIKDLCKKPYSETRVFDVYNEIQRKLKI